MHAGTLIGGRGLPAPMEAFAARNLQLLTAIESTITALRTDTELLNALTKSYEEIRDGLSVVSQVIDPCGNIENSLSKASDSCVRIYQNAVKRHGSACADARLKPDDGVVDAYQGHIDAVHHLHGLVEDLREWIATHDAVLEPATSSVYACAEDLFTSLMSDE